MIVASLLVETDAFVKRPRNLRLKRAAKKQGIDVRCNCSPPRFFQVARVGCWGAGEELADAFERGVARRRRSSCRHWQPVAAMYKIAFTTVRRSVARGRHIRFLFGINGAINDHSPSVMALA